VKLEPLNPAWTLEYADMDPVAIGLHIDISPALGKQPQ
jgi:hypothetical protein